MHFCREAFRIDWASQRGRGQSKLQRLCDACRNSRQLPPTHIKGRPHLHPLTHHVAYLLCYSSWLQVQYSTLPLYAHSATFFSHKNWSRTLKSNGPRNLLAVTCRLPSTENNFFSGQIISACRDRGAYIFDFVPPWTRGIVEFSLSFCYIISVVSTRGTHHMEPSPSFSRRDQQRHGLNIEAKQLQPTSAFNLPRLRPSSQSFTGPSPMINAAMRQEVRQQDMNRG